MRRRLLVQACLSTGWLAGHASPLNAISLPSNHCHLPTGPPTAFPKCSPRAAIPPTDSCRPCDDHMMVLVLKRGPLVGGTYCDCLLKGSGKMRLSDNSQVHGGSRGTWGWWAHGTEGSMGHGWELTACRCPLTASQAAPRPAHWAALNGGLFVESTAYEGLGVCIENKSRWLSPLLSQRQLREGTLAQPHGPRALRCLLRVGCRPVAAVSLCHRGRDSHVEGGPCVFLRHHLRRQLGNHRLTRVSLKCLPRRLPGGCALHSCHWPGRNQAISPFCAIFPPGGRNERVQSAPELPAVPSHPVQLRNAHVPAPPHMASCSLGL